MELSNIRERLDGIDRQLTDLFVQRMQTVADVAAAKRDSGKAIRDHARERNVLNRVTERAGEEYAPYVKDLYKLIFELSCNYQSTLMGYTSPLTRQLEEACLSPEGEHLPGRALVACQGTEGAYAQQACDRVPRAGAAPVLRVFCRASRVYRRAHGQYRRGGGVCRQDRTGRRGGDRLQGLRRAV